LVPWLLGFLTFYLGVLIHILIIAAIVVLVPHLVTGQSAIPGGTGPDRVRFGSSEPCLHARRDL
jgi:hypothetical protein